METFFRAEVLETLEGFFVFVNLIDLDLMDTFGTRGWIFRDFIIEIFECVKIVEEIYDWDSFWMKVENKRFKI